MNTPKVIPYCDLKALAEDDRIATIARTVLQLGKSVGFLVDDDAKADRYCAKLTERFPEITVAARLPMQGGILVRVEASISKN